MESFPPNRMLNLGLDILVGSTHVNTIVKRNSITIMEQMPVAGLLRGWLLVMAAITLAMMVLGNMAMMDKKQLRLA